MSRYEVVYSDPSGVRRGESLLPVHLEFVRVVNGIGWMKIVLPADDYSRFKVDGILEIWRGAEGDVLKRQISGFLRKFRFFTNSEGFDGIELAGPDVNDLIKRRIVAYAAGTSQSSKTDNVDDMIKAIVRENLGSSAPAVRDYTNNDFSVIADAGLGSSITRGFSWRELERVFSDLTDTAAQLTPEIYWEVLHTGEATFNFVTYQDQPGSDHTLSTGRHPVTFSKEYNNLENPNLTLDYQDEITYVYAGGQGEESDREIVEVEDADRSARSIWGRREAFVDARNESTTAGVTAVARAKLYDGRPRLLFSGQLMSTPQTEYGKDWGFGDRVTVLYRGLELSGLVRSVHITVDDNGDETINARFEVEDVI